MQVEYPEVGVCGLSCRLCPNYHTSAESKCDGCKTPSRMVVGCPFITCAVKRKAVSFCWDCAESDACDRWREHREYGKAYDTFVCYRRLEDNIASIRRGGVAAFDETQREKARILGRILKGFNEGRSRRYYCVAATLLSATELKAALRQAESESAGMDAKGCSKVMHAILDEAAIGNGYTLKLRKPPR
jgi:hypothetical protein